VNEWVGKITRSIFAGKSYFRDIPVFINRILTNLKTEGYNLRILKKLINQNIS